MTEGASFLKIDGKLHNVDQIASVGHAKKKLKDEDGEEFGTIDVVTIKFVGGEKVNLKNTTMDDFEGMLTEVATIVDCDEKPKKKKKGKK